MTSIDQLNRYATRRDAEAFAALVQEYAPMVLATCRRQLRGNGADDAVQETFLRLAKSAGTVRSNLGAWLHRCAINVATDLQRRQATRHRHESAAATADVAPSDAQRELAELREQIDAALLKLDEPSRELIVQRFFVGQPQAALAAAAGVSPSAISQRIERAIDAQPLHGVLAGRITGPDGKAVANAVVSLEGPSRVSPLRTDAQGRIPRASLSPV